MTTLEAKLNDCQKICDQDPSPENMNMFEVLKTEFELQNDYITQGAIIRTRATWYEQGEKSNKYFLNLENSRGKKSSIRKIVKEDESSTSNPQVIMKELRSFYSDLYKKGVNENSETLTDLFMRDLHLPSLTSDQRERCDGKLSVGECFNTLKTFQKNKTPGNDGLTVEFYLVFWPIVGKHLVDCFNYAHDHGELSNSQKQAVITLLEKKGKDKRLIKNWRPISLINVDVKIASKTLAKRLEPIRCSYVCSYVADTVLWSNRIRWANHIMGTCPSKLRRWISKLSICYALLTSAGVGSVKEVLWCHPLNFASLKHPTAKGRSRWIKLKFCSESKNP